MPPGPILWSWSVDETVLFSALSRLIKTLSVASSFWKIKDFSREPIALFPGTLGRDQKGFFFAHREGKIRLLLDLSPLGIAQAWRQRNKTAPIFKLSHH